MTVKDTDTGVEFHVKVVPGASRTQVAGSYDEMLKVRISAAPEKGKANKELIGFLSKLLNLKKNDIEIVSGTTNTVKKIRLVCTDREKTRQKVNSLLQA